MILQTKRGNNNNQTSISLFFKFIYSNAIPHQPAPLVLPDQPVADHWPVPVVRAAGLVVPLGVAARAVPREGAEGEAENCDGEAYQEKVARPVVVAVVVPVVVGVRHALPGYLQAHIIVKYRLRAGRRGALGRLLEVDVDGGRLHVDADCWRLHVYVDGSGLDVYVVGVYVARI